MWFIQGGPTSVNAEIIIKSIEYGYQHTGIKFSVDSPDENLRIALAFPWSPNKPTGSFEVLPTSLFNTKSTDIQLLDMSQIQIWERLRKLKEESDIDLINVDEIVNWYLDDFGVFTIRVEPNKTYEINYKHKLASDSALFFPSRLPTVIAIKKPKMEYNMTVIGSNPTFLPKQLVRESTSDDILKVTFNDWDWDDDTRIATDNWLSSSDNLESSSDDSD